MSIEQDIAERLGKGDPQAGKLLYETYARWLLGVCLRYVGDRATAEDLLHDGFVRILTHANQFGWQGEGSLKGWLFRVQQHTILMYLRQQGRLDEMLSLDDVSATDIVDPETTRDIPRAVLMKFIAQLPAGYRTVFNMFVIDGLSHKEIARMLGIKEKTSASQLVHARRLLASRINQWRNENL